MRNFKLLHVLWRWKVTFSNYFNWHNRLSSRGQSVYLSFAIPGKRYTTHYSYREFWSKTPQRSDLLICLCKRSFFSVPHPGGMSERHPFCMCLRRHSNWWRVSLDKRSFQENNNRSRFASISSEPGVLVVLSVPRSPFRRKMRDNSEENCLP